MPAAWATPKWVVVAELSRAFPDAKDGGTVLVVEDDEDSSLALSQRLALQGFRVLAAESAGAAWPLIGQHAPRAIVMDLKLPGIDGSTFARHIRHELGADVVLVAYTGLPVDGVDRSVFDAVLEKPDLERVAASLHGLLCSQRSPGSID